MDFLEVEGGRLIKGEVIGGEVVGARLINLETGQIRHPRTAKFYEWTNVKMDNAYYRNNMLCQKPGTELKRKLIFRKKDDVTKIPKASGALPVVPDPVFNTTSNLAVKMSTAIKPTQPKPVSPYAPPKKTLAKRSSILLVHASDSVVIKPQWDYAAAADNQVKDFGVGFYTCQTDEYPVKFARSKTTVVVNEYKFNFEGLRVLRLKNDVHWLLATAFHRDNFERRHELHSLRDWYRKWVADCDIVIGAISDDQFFSTFGAFLTDMMSDYVTLNVVQMMNYPEQIVSKSAKADSQFTFVRDYTVSQTRLEQVKNKASAELENMDELIRKRRNELRKTDNGLMFSELVEVVKKELRLI